ncbi:MAG: class I SAM-dependent methyltransferase [Clostridia bacterium]|nr:class I SAM-dependent methyltransferase [Clostridia bacterium]
MSRHLTEDRWERKLGINTFCANHEKDDSNHSRYEPTPYSVLERLSESGLIGSNDVMVDYGCGKGRVGFYMTHAVGCESIGVEYDEKLIAEAEQNLSEYAGKREKVHFVSENAENYVVGNASCFYFFNPFSVKILKSVLGRIYDSYYGQPRAMRLFFYYALDSYRTELMNENNLKFECEINCMDLFYNPDEKEKILVFSVE